MSETPGVVAAVFAGMLLGVIFFGGLWWTIRKGLSSPLAPVWFSGSFLLRTAIAAGGFFFVSQGDWRRVAGCLAGFLLARGFVTRLTRSEASA